MKRSLPSFSVLFLAGAAILVGTGLGLGGAMVLRYSRSVPAADVRAADKNPQTIVASAAEPDGLALSREDQQYIWDAEHHALELGARAIPRLVRALQAGELDTLSRFFSPQFEGRLPELTTSEAHHHGPIEFRVYAEATNGAPGLSSSEFCARLLDYRAMFDNLLGAQLAVMKMNPDLRAQPDGPSSGTWKLRMWGTAEGGGPRELVLTGSFSIAATTRDVLESYGWLMRWETAQVELRTAPAPLMREVAEARGFPVSRLYDTWQYTQGPPPVVTGGVFISDYDDDGWFDVVVMDLTGTMLFRGGPSGTFSDVTAQAKLVSFFDSAPKALTWLDFDNDGFDDLIIGTRALRNCGTGEFIDVTSEIGTDRMARGSAYAVADYDGDGLVDLYLTISSQGPIAPVGRQSSWLKDSTSPGNQLWRNHDGRFEDVTTLANASGGHLSTFTAAWLDVDGDGLPDLAVIDEFGAPALLRNRGDGSFDQQPLVDGFGGFCMGVASGDLDEDGRSDLYLANMYSKAGNRIFANLRRDAYPPEVYAKIMEFTRGSELLRNTGGRLEKHGMDSRVNDVGWAYGPCMLDLDNDGRLDLYAPAGFQSITRGEPDG